MKREMESGWSRIGWAAVVTGAVAALVSSAALAALAKAEGKGAFQPTNATSHWLNGDAAAKVELPSASHTLVGFLTHLASAILWAAPFEAWLSMRPSPSIGDLMRGAAGMSAIAAAVDYGPTPRRFTPGWELVVSKPAMAVTYVALALGLAIGAAAQRMRQPARLSWRGTNPLRMAYWQASQNPLR